MFSAGMREAPGHLAVFQQNDADYEKIGIRLNWNVLFGLGDDAPWFTAEIPTLFISTQNPYHLFDAPMMKTYINTYDNNDFLRAALMDKLMGRSPFKGQSPVDPYCGNPYI